MENKQSLEMASADGLYINEAEACMVLDWTVMAFCKFNRNSSCQCKPLPSRRGQWWRWQILLTSSLGALAGPGLLFFFFRPWRNYALQLHHWGRNLFPDPSSSFQDPKAPILYWIFRSQFGFQIGVPVFSVTTCWVECSGIICNLGI
jgi:hypothetical protein